MGLPIQPIVIYVRRGRLTKQWHAAVTSLFNNSKYGFAYTTTGHLASPSRPSPEERGKLLQQFYSTTESIGLPIQPLGICILSMAASVAAISVI